MGRRRAVACLLVLALVLGGCWDRIELEDTAYVVSLGVDAAGDEYLWTFRVVAVETLPVGMLTSPPTDMGRMASTLLTVRGTSLGQAIQLLQASLVRIVSLDHLRYIVFSQEVASQGLNPLLSQILRHDEARRGAGAGLALGRAVDVFRSNAPLEELNPAKFMEGVLLVQKRMHLSPPVRLQHFYSRLLAPGADPFLPLIGVNPLVSQPPESLPPMAGRSLTAGEFPRSGGNPVEVAGTAVFKGDKLAGLLNVDETAVLLALRGEMGKFYATLPDPQEPSQTLTLRFHQENKPQYRARFVRDRPAVHIRLQFEGEILSSPGRTDYTEPANRRKLEQYAARSALRSTFAVCVGKVYQDWGADPVGLGNLFRTRFPTFDAWLGYNWPDHVRDLQVSLEVDLFIRRFGLLLGETPAR